MLILLEQSYIYIKRFIKKQFQECKNKNFAQKKMIFIYFQDY